MSGHSKWENIRRTKEKNDAVKGKVFTKLVKDIIAAVKTGGSADVNSNSKLREAVSNAKANNLPNDNIKRAIKKASGEANGANYEEVVYEGYGPVGSALIIYALTDNKNRTAGYVRHLLDKGNGTLGTVSYMFSRKGVLVVEAEDDLTEDDLMLYALDAGAEDVKIKDQMYQIITESSEVLDVKKKLEEKGLKFLSAESQMVPSDFIKMDEGKQNSFQKMIDGLEALDEVQSVYHNVDFQDYEPEEE